MKTKHKTNTRGLAFVPLLLVGLGAHVVAGLVGWWAVGHYVSKDGTPVGPPQTQPGAWLQPIDQ